MPYRIAVGMWGASTRLPVDGEPLQGPLSSVASVGLRALPRVSITWRT